MDLAKLLVRLHKATDLLNDVVADHLRRTAVGAQPGRVLTVEELGSVLTAISDAERALRPQSTEGNTDV